MKKIYEHLVQVLVLQHWRVLSVLDFQDRCYQIHFTDLETDNIEVKLSVHDYVARKQRS